MPWGWSAGRIRAAAADARARLVTEDEGQQKVLARGSVLFRHGDRRRHHLDRRMPPGYKVALVELEPRARGTIDQGGKQGIGGTPAPDERSPAPGASRQHVADEAFHLLGLHADGDRGDAVGEDPAAPIDDRGGKVLEGCAADEFGETAQVIGLGHRFHASISSARCIHSAAPSVAGSPKRRPTT